MKRLRDSLTFNSVLKYFLWKALGCSYDLTVKLKTGQYLVIGRSPSTDSSTGYEIFVNETYKIPTDIDANQVKSIVDVGANIGYSCIYWLNNYPNAQITAFEPHPRHIEKINTHLRLNHASDRVKVFASAAGCQAGLMYLTDDQVYSQIVDAPQNNSIPVSVIDWFEAIGTKEIDILKIDIEGGEYALLSDPRFKDVNFKTLVMEWHDTTAYPDGFKWCMDKLKELNYTTIGQKGPDDYCGMLFAFPNS